MRSLLRFTGFLLAVLLLAAALAWWWYLRAESMAPPTLPGVVERGETEFDGRQRSWLAYVPAAKVARPALVLVMHGSMGDGEGMRATVTRFGFDVLAERHGFVVVYPDGYERHWNDCRAGADYAANLENVDDVGFLRALVGTLVRAQGVDPAKVFATGLSNGGQMAYRLGLEAPELVAGIAAVAANLPMPDNLDCEPSGEAVAALVMNGTADPVNPYGGGLVEIFGNSSRGEVLSAEDTARYWAGLAGYSGDGQRRAWPEREPGDGTSVQSIEWQAPGKPPVSLVTIVGGGHTVPHPLFGLPRILGPTSHELDGAEVIWHFFSAAVGAAP